MRFAALLVPVAAGLFASATSATDADGATLARQGNGHGAVACTACHGADGGGQAATGFPRLAGLNAAYVRKQLDDFADGTRVNAVMQPVASALTADERTALASYYARLPVPVLSRPAGDSTSASSVGERLATRGRWTQGVPGCAQCHGPGGVGVGAHFPPLAGQSATYIANQLKAWQQGTRHNDPLQLMQHVAARLDAGDIAAVSAWYATQPLPAAAAEDTR